VIKPILTVLVLAALGFAGVIGYEVYFENSGITGMSGGSGGLIETISKNGERVTLEDHLPASGKTIVAFYADW